MENTYGELYRQLMLHINKALFEKGFISKTVYEQAQDKIIQLYKTKNK